MANVTIDMSGDAARLIREQAKITRQQAQILRGYQKLGGGAQQAGRHASRAARKASDDSARVGSAIKGQIAGLVGMLGISGGLAGAVSLIKTGFENWHAILTQISAEVKKAGSEIIAFAALQEGGTKAERVTAASQLAQRYGITERGVAFDTVQAMQSMLGDFQEGMGAAETIFRAKQVGIPVDLGKELEVLGISAGLKPGEALRKAYVAGELSGRTPAAMAKAAEALEFFGDKDVMFAMGAQLAGTVPEKRISTYMKRLGMGLRPTSGLADWYKQQKLGVGATQLERLEVLASKMATMSSEQQDVLLQTMGLVEIRERQAVKSLLPHLGRIRQHAKQIERLAVPGLLVEKRAGVEAELPWMKTAREMGMLSAAYAEEKAFGAGAPGAAAWEKERAIRALALKRLGREQALAWPTITETEEGIQASPWAQTRAELQEFLIPLLARPRGVPLTAGAMVGAEARGQFTRDLEAQKTEIRSWLEANQPQVPGPYSGPRFEPATIPGAIRGRSPAFSPGAGPFSLAELDRAMVGVSRAADQMQQAADAQKASAAEIRQAGEDQRKATTELRRVTDRMGGGGGRRLGSPTEDR